MLSFENRCPDLLHLIRLSLRACSLEIDPGGNTVLAKNVMAVLHSLLQPQALQETEEVLEPDCYIGCPAQNPSKDLV